MLIEGPNVKYLILSEVEAAGVAPGDRTATDPFLRDGIIGRMTPGNPQASQGERVKFREDTTETHAFYVKPDSDGNCPVGTDDALLVTQVREYGILRTLAFPIRYTVRHVWQEPGMRLIRLGVVIS